MHAVVLECRGSAGTSQTITASMSIFQVSSLLIFSKNEKELIRQYSYVMSLSLLYHCCVYLEHLCYMKTSHNVPGMYRLVHVRTSLQPMILCMQCSCKGEGLQVSHSQAV